MADDDVKAFGDDDSELDEDTVPAEVAGELLDDEVLSLDALGDEEDLDADDFDDKEAF